jgi:hypothetical protein
MQPDHLIKCCQFLSRSLTVIQPFSYCDSSPSQSGFCRPQARSSDSHFKQRECRSGKCRYLKRHTDKMFVSPYVQSRYPSCGVSNVESELICLDRNETRETKQTVLNTVMSTDTDPYGIKSANGKS